MQSSGGDTQVSCSQSRSRETLELTCVEESLLVIRGLGIQTSTTSSTYLSTSATRFIPTDSIQDIFIHEAFKGFEVKFYLAVVVEGEEEVVVVFPVGHSFCCLSYSYQMTLIQTLTTVSRRCRISYRSAKYWSRFGGEPGPVSMNQSDNDPHSKFVHCDSSVWAINSAML